MDFQESIKKKIESASNIKRKNTEKIAPKHSKKKALKESESSASLHKNTLQGSTFCTLTSKSLPKKANQKKVSKNKKASKGKENAPSKSKQKKKTVKIKKEKMEELTHRKKIHLEFFMYKDTYLPIENT